MLMYYIRVPVTGGPSLIHTFMTAYSNAHNSVTFWILSGMSSAPSSEAAGEPAPPPPRALKREPVQWEMHMEPSTGRAFYTNDAGATVDAVPEGDVVVGDLPFPDQAEPNAQLEVKSDEPPSEKPPRQNSPHRSQK